MNGWAIAGIVVASMLCGGAVALAGFLLWFGRSLHW